MILITTEHTLVTITTICTTVSKPQTSTSCLEKMDNNKAPNIPSVYSVGTTNTSRFNKISGIISLNEIQF